MLEFLFSVVFEFFGELLLQLVAEGLGDAARAGWFKATGRERKTGVFGEIAWAAVTGCIAAGITLYFFPHLALRLVWLQALNIVLAPLAAGLLVERWKALRGHHEGFGAAAFSYAALFGFAFALTRFLGGR